MEEDKKKDEEKDFAKEDKKMRGQVKVFGKEEDKQKMKDDVNLGGLLDRMIPIKEQQQQQQQQGEGEEEQPQNIAPSQEQIKEEKEEGENKKVDAKNDRIARDVTVQQYHEILSEDINLLNGLSKAIRNYCGRKSDARFENLITDYREIVDIPSSDFKGLGERLCKLQKDYKLTYPVEDMVKDQVNLGGGFLDRVIPTQDEQPLVVMDKDKAKRDILVAMKLLWNKINSVQDSAQQQPINITSSEKESKEKEEEEKQMADIQREKNSLDSTKIAKNDRDEREVGDGFRDVEQLLSKWEEMEKRETKKQRKIL